MVAVASEPKFPMGRIVATPGALAAFADAGQTPDVFLARHVRGDWGEIDASDKRANDFDLANGGRLLSAYTLGSSVRVWIITETDRSSTCILLPEEY
jgi:hypothetical protein